MYSFKIKDDIHSTMTSTFDRPVGAVADVVELDYVSALHQTDVTNGVRKEGSIQGKCTAPAELLCALFAIAF